MGILEIAMGSIKFLVIYINAQQAWKICCSFGLVSCKDIRVWHLSIIDTASKSNSSMASEIQQLSDLIASSVSTLFWACEDNKTPFPNPNQPFAPHSEAFRASQAASDATNLIAASALQLVARVLPPDMSVFNIACVVRRRVLCDT